MKLKKGIAPFYRRQESVHDLMTDMLIPLVLLLVIPTVNHGLRTIVLTGVCVLTCLLCEIMFCLFSGHEITVLDGSSTVTGMVIAMLLPVNIPFRIAFIACLFAILLAKMPFGGVGRAPFNPAAAGIAFVTIAFPSAMFAYRDPLASQTMDAFAKNVEVQTTASPAALLKIGARPSLQLNEMLFGRFAGPMGATAVLVILACALFLILRKTARWETMVSFLGASMLFSALFPRLSTGRIESVFFEIMSGSLLFCAVFMATEPGTSPKLPIARCIYGFLGGIITMLFRYFGVYEQGACFALLLINALAPSIDRVTWNLMERGGEHHA